MVVPDASKPEATDSQNQTDAVLNVEEEDQVDVNLTDSEKKPETTPPPAPSQEEQQAASEKDEPIVHESDSNQPQTGDTQGGSIYLEGFGWITDEGGGTVQENVPEAAADEPSAQAENATIEEVNFDKYTGARTYQAYFESSYDTKSPFDIYLSLIHI